MPRTTLDIDAVVLRKLKEIQRREHKTLGQVASELLARVIGSETADEELPGAHVVALMHEHGVGTIYSRDRDFRSSMASPRSIRSTSGSRPGSTSEYRSV